MTIVCASREYVSEVNIKVQQGAGYVWRESEVPRLPRHDREAVKPDDVMEV